MKKWMILAAAILVVLGIGFAVKGASDRKPTVQPSETALPEATAEPEQAALTDETQTEDGMTQVYMLHGQTAALAVNIYPLAGTVDEVQEDGRVLVTPTDGGAQVLLSLPEDVTVEAGETATFYTTGVATMSLPAQMNAIGVVK